MIKNSTLSTRNACITRQNAINFNNVKSFSKLFLTYNNLISPTIFSITLVEVQGLADYNEAFIRLLSFAPGLITFSKV